MAAQQADIRSKAWTVNIPNDVVTGDFVFVSGDSDIAKHYADSTAVALFFKLGKTIVGNMFPILCQTNNDFGLESYCGVNLRFNSAGTTLSGNGINKTLSQTDNYKTLRADSSGTLKFVGASATYGLAAGDYIVVFAW